MGCQSGKSVQTAASPPKLMHSKSTLEATPFVMSTQGADKPVADTDTVATVSTTDNTDDAPCIVLSEYNYDNYCTVTRVLRTGPGRIALDFVAVGDGSLGSKLPDPMGSVLAWPSGSVKPTSKVIEREDSQYISGTLLYTFDQDFCMFYYLSGELTFSYGPVGFSVVSVIVQGAGTDIGAQAWTQLNQDRVVGGAACTPLARVSEGGDSYTSEPHMIQDPNVDRGVLLLPKEDTAETTLPGENTQPLVPNNAPDAVAAPATITSEQQPVVLEGMPPIIVRGGPEADVPICCRACCYPSSPAATTFAKASM